MNSQILIARKEVKLVVETTVFVWLLSQFGNFIITLYELLFFKVK